MKRISRYLIDAQTLIEGLESSEGSPKGDSLDVLWKLAENNRIEVLIKVEEWETLKKHLYDNINSRRRAEAILYDIGKVIKVSSQGRRKDLKVINFSRVSNAPGEESTSVEEIVIQNSLFSLNTSSVMLQSFAAIATILLAKEALRIELEGEDFLLNGVGTLFGTNGRYRPSLEALIKQEIYSDSSEPNNPNYLGIIASGPGRLQALDSARNASMNGHEASFTIPGNWQVLLNIINSAAGTGAFSYQDLQDDGIRRIIALGSQNTASGTQASSDKFTSGKVAGKLASGQIIQQILLQAESTSSTASSEDEGSVTDDAPDSGLSPAADEPSASNPQGASNSQNNEDPVTDSPVYVEIYPESHPGLDDGEEGLDSDAFGPPSQMSFGAALSYAATLSDADMSVFVSDSGGETIPSEDFGQSDGELLDLSADINFHLFLEANAYQSIYDFETAFASTNGVFTNPRTFELLASPDLMRMVVGVAPRDTLEGNAGDNWILGSFGNDLLRARTGNDLLDGSFGDDQLNGGIGDDILNGGYDDDVLNGGSGNDLLLGSIGTDVLTGGTGLDTFFLQYDDDGIDTITDFNALEGDHIVITGLYDPSDYAIDIIGGEQGTTLQLSSRWSFLNDGVIADAPTELAFLAGVTSVSSEDISFA